MDKKYLCKYVSEIARDITVSCANKNERYMNEAYGKDMANFYNALFDGILEKMSDTELLYKQSI